MARFIGWAQGNRGETHRLGTAASGIEVIANGWDLGVKVQGGPYHADKDRDGFDVYVTGGSNGSRSGTYLGYVTTDENGAAIFVPGSRWLAEMEDGVATLD